MSVDGGASASEACSEGRLVSQSDTPGQGKRKVGGKQTKARPRPATDAAESIDVCSSMAAWYCVSPFCIDAKYLNPTTTSPP